MELDFGTLAIGVFALLLCIVPFVLDYKSRKKKENNLLEPLKKIAQQQNCQIGEHEVCQNFIIGIDKGKKSVFFYKEEKGKITEHFIDLATIQTCKVVTSYRTTSNSKTVNKLELSFIDKNKIEQTVDIYNADGISRLNGEIQLANKWHKIVTNQLND